MVDKQAVITQLRSHGFNEGADEIERMKVRISEALTHLPAVGSISHYSPIVVQDRVNRARECLRSALED